MEYKKEDVENWLDSWIEGIKNNPLKTSGYVLLLLFIIGIGIFISSYISAKADQLARVENNVKTIAETLETLVIAQQITKLSSDNAIVLDYEPVPQSIKITVGPLTNFPRPNYGYKLHGNKIYIIHPDTLKRVKGRLPTGVTVEYLRKINIKKAID